MADLKGNPFFLSEERAAWVESTLAHMSTDEKIGQLFCPVGFGSDDATLDFMIGECRIGGMMYRTGQMKDIQETYRKIQSRARIPLLLAANTESGGNGIVAEGTSFGKPMAVAATGDPENAYRMGYTACAEGAAVGMNWSFAPIIDIDYNFHNPITNVRTFGSDPETVLSFAREYLRGADEAGVAVAIKHFPGDGTDERDQHILTSVNSLAADEWMRTYGHVYSELIRAGAKSVMVGHIAQPALVSMVRPDASYEERMLPGSLSKELITGVLREKLGFNGVISTDSSAMVGYLCAMPREKAVPASIEAGCDIVLFNKDLAEDITFMKKGLENGLLSEKRLNEAVERVLALKASLGLIERQAAGTLVPGEEALAQIGTAEHRAWSREVADRAVTLVKDTQQLLPISSARYPRVYLNVIERKRESRSAYALAWKELFEKEGFAVTLRDRSVTIEMENFMGMNMTPAKAALMDELYRPVEKFKDSTDLYVYVANIENASNNTTARLDWNVIFGLGDDAPWFVQEKPALFISTANPYHLFDAPMLKTFINAYDGSAIFREAVMDKIMGRSAFKGVSPVDVTCGCPYISTEV